MMHRDVLGLEFDELKGLLAQWGHPLFYAKSIFAWIYGKGVSDFSRMSDIPVLLREKLAEGFAAYPLTVQKRVRSRDGTQKFLCGLSDGQCIEAVIIPAKGRVTACVSTQVGCKFACRFCASGVKGFTRQLSAAEILNEVMTLQRESASGPLTHVVFMGTGEPFDNYDEVMKAVRMINSSHGFGIGARRITISTCGVIPGILKMAGEGLQVELSISLHAADDVTRNSLVPVNKKYPLAQLMDACARYTETTNRQVTFEYILLKGINADLQSAQKLSILLKKVRVPKVNLIPANQVKELRIESPSMQDVLRFQGVLRDAGIPVTLREPRGQDIEAACGQLRLRHGA